MTASAATPQTGSSDNFRKAADAASAAANAAADAVKNLRVPDMAVLDVDIKKSVTWNFLVQLVLSGVSWAIAFFTSHAAVAKVRETCMLYSLHCLPALGLLLSSDTCLASSTFHRTTSHPFVLIWTDTLALRRCTAETTPLSHNHRRAPAYTSPPPC